MNVFKSLRAGLGRKKNSAGSAQSTSEIISHTGSIDDFAVGTSSFQNGDTRSNNNGSSSNLKKVVRSRQEPVKAQLAPPSVSPRKSPSPRTRSSNQASMATLEAKLAELSGAVDPTLSVRSITQSAKTIMPEKNNFDSELRHLDTKIRLSITTELDATNSWKLLAGKITHPDRPSEPLFTDLHLLNDPSKVRSMTEEILKTWSTTGRNRPRIRDLYDLLKEIKELKLAQGLQEAVLGTFVSLSPDEDSEQVSLWSNRFKDKSSSAVRIPVEFPSNLYHICFGDLDSATEHFSPSSRTKIAEGNFGIVYKVKIDEEDMAVKVFKEDINQIANEIEKLSSFSHPNVLSLYGYSVGPDLVCIVTRYMKNGSLQQMLARKILSWRERMGILKDVAAGLEYVHSKNVLHRDIKPANILLDENMVALIADFGLARTKVNSATSMTYTYGGSAFYMAPEVRHHIVSLKSDVYSFGVVALELFTGLPIFNASRQEVLTEHVAKKGPNDVCDSRIEQLPEAIKEECYGDIELCLLPVRTERPDMKYIHQHFQMFFDAICDEESSGVADQ